MRPNLSVFGQKDGQQVAIIERMVEDLDMDVQIVRGPIVREPDGLAMSSRNGYLSDEERAEAPVLHEALGRAGALFDGGETSVERVLGEVRTLIESRPHAEVQYVSAVDWKSLDEADGAQSRNDDRAGGLLRRTRLIDNLVLGDVGGEG